MKPLSDRERMQALVSGHPVDRLPVQPMLMTFAGKFAGIPFGEYCRKGEKMAEAQLKTWRALGTDMLLTCSDPAREVIDLAGEESVRWFEDQPPAIFEDNAALKDKSRLKTLSMPDLSKPGRMQDRLEAIRILRREAGPDAVIVGWVEGALALAAELRGINAIMLDFYDDPDFVEELFTFCADLSCEYAAAQVQAGADSIGMSDAAASMMGPEFYEKHLWPRQRQILSTIRQNGAMSRVHMCGCTDALLGKMAELPVDVYEIDFKTNLAKARAAFSDAAVICGNIDTIGVMLHGDSERVRAEAKKCHRICGNRHIVAPGCETAPLTPVENVKTLVRYAASTMLR